MSVSLLLTFVLAAYLAGSVLYVAGLFTTGRRLSVLATVLTAAGAAAHTAALVLISMKIGRSPYSTFYGAVAFMAWLVALMQLAAVGGWRTYALGAISLPIAFLMLLFALALPPEMREVIPELRRHTMAAHISLAILGYGAFAVAFGLALIYLLQNRLLKAKQLRGLFERLPPLRTTEDLAGRFAAFGHAMLTMGLIIGSIYGMKLYGHDPKVLASLITWGIYTTFLILRYGLGWRGKVSSYLLVVGFIAVLITFVGMNLLFPGTHRVVE